MKTCPTCGQPIRVRRSDDISTHFHAHVTQLAKLTAMSRDEVYIRALVRACEIDVDGVNILEGYPSTIVDGVLHPKRTTNRTNKEMMAAVEACHLLAAEWEVGPLKEEGG